MAYIQFVAVVKRRVDMSWIPGCVLNAFRNRKKACFIASLSLALHAFSTCIHPQFIPVSVAPTLK